MWTTSNSRDDNHRGCALAFKLFTCAVLVLALVLSVSAQGVVPPDAPRPARKLPQEKSRPATRQTGISTTVELLSVRVRRIDETTRKLAGQRFLQMAKEPLTIDVRTRRPLGDLEGASSPEIVLNGTVLHDTRAIPPNRLVAFLPDRAAIKETNSVAVVWVGREESTKTRRPLTFRAADVR